ncbi:cilia- and flagella-associated protein 99 [Parambassis ranga]|uniref:Cilia- and flagella-associated protein 99 n=1 Tax=Parambassis ranga TaxID=210632 RepID=A0A6P7HMJ6_9TELE|nr:cilia- and flagella-associated protein 99 [Parambassis ranga]
MPLRYGSLVKEAIVLLDRFTEGRQCLDDFIEDAVKDLQNIDTLQRKFILDVVSGCVERQKLLDVVIDAFYGQNRTCLSRGDRSHFIIICYLATFALDDLGFQQFSNIVKSLDLKKMQRFLGFFFPNLTTWIQDEWNSIYDAAFVEKNLIGPLVRWRPQIDALMDQLAVKISQENQLKQAPVKITQPNEFALTKPKPRPLPLPEPIPQQEKPKPAPSSTYRPPKETEIIKDIKQKNHQKAQELLYEANMKQFRCVNPPKSEHTESVMSRTEGDFDSKPKMKSSDYSGPPSSQKAVPIKLNNAAILRREALFDRQLEKEMQRIKQLVQGAREPSSFLEWQKEMLEKDHQEKLLMMERRRLEGCISEEASALTRQEVMERNQKIAQLKREETAKLMQRYAQKRLQEENEMRDLVQLVAEGHKNSKAAKQKLQKLKQTIVKEVSEQSQELLRQALEEAQAELSRKFEIIKEIRTIQSLSHVRVKNFNDTVTAGHALMVEMSLAELKERLALLKEARQTEEQERRKHILEEKQKQKQLLQEKLDNIELHSRILTQAAVIRKEERKAKLDVFQKAVAEDETVLALHKKLVEKKQARQRLKQIESSKARPSKQAAAPTACSTGTHNQRKVKTWEELEQSLEHYIEDTP